ncbi:unnamed protein product [Triticum turgidum subsp. durum]|uniref:AB hydrolase-1 domain-containing protein n=1 Tax=Triticum turgidum subsp. durum TaxID=4567 RepID=A0A9R0SDY5_TRITD|nr:unnamed protein product [Triticum turgidum subsp. durum]
MGRAPTQPDPDQIRGIDTSTCCSTHATATILPPPQAPTTCAEERNTASHRKSPQLNHGEGNWVSLLDNGMKPQDADGRLPASFMFGPQFIQQKLYQLCSSEDITLAKSLMRVGSLFLEDLQARQPFTEERYGSVRKVYVVCKQDVTIPEAYQMLMVAKNPVDEVREIDGADHMAMLSAPEQVVKCILDIAEKYK